MRGLRYSSSKGRGQEQSGEMFMTAKNRPRELGAGVREGEPRAKRGLRTCLGWRKGGRVEVTQSFVSQQAPCTLGLKPRSSRTLSQVRLKSFKGTG